MLYVYHGGKDALRNKLGDEKILENAETKDREMILEAKVYLEKQPSWKIQDHVKVATQSSSNKKKLCRLEGEGKYKPIMRYWK